MTQLLAVCDLTLLANKTNKQQQQQQQQQQKCWVVAYQISSSII